MFVDFIFPELFKFIVEGVSQFWDKKKFYLITQQMGVFLAMFFM